MRGIRFKYDEHVLWSWQPAQAQAWKDPCFFSVLPIPIVHTVSGCSYNGRSLDGGPPAKRSRRSPTGLKEWHRLHGEEARLCTARRRSGETEGQAASRRGNNLLCLCLTIRKWPFVFKPAEVQSRTKFLNGVICGLSDRSGSEEAERSHRSKATKLSGAQERSDKVERGKRSEATKLSGVWIPKQRTPGWTASG